MPYVPQHPRCAQLWIVLVVALCSLLGTLEVSMAAVCVPTYQWDIAAAAEVTLCSMCN